MKALAKSRYRVVAGRNYGTPKEVWGFRTRPTKATRRRVAGDFLAANRGLFALRDDLEGLDCRRTISSLGAEHVIYSQSHCGLRIHRAYVTVHMGSADRSVYLAKNRAVPDYLLPKAPVYRIGKADAQRRARRSIRTSGRGVKPLKAEQMWYFRKGKLLPAWRVQLHCGRPREEWLVFVHGKTGGILDRYDNLARAVGRARVFDPNPVIALDDHAGLLTKNGNARRKPPIEAYKTVRLTGLKGNGYLEGARVTTKPTRRRIKRKNHKYLFESTKRGFEEAMAYYHIDRAIRYLESLGYKGARRIFTEPVPVNVNGTREDNSWYSPGLRRLTFGSGGVDDAEDGETILHEFGHALQDAIVPGFGQSIQAAAMGEGFSDYFAASFFADRKSPTYRPTVMSWDGITWARDDGPPCVRRLDEEYTYEDFEHAEDEEHFNGQIWSAALWAIRRKLGRAVADRVIVESHFQLDGFTTMARGARAIVDADRNLNNGKNVAKLRKVFRDRGIGPV